ncbi:hypothetical protein COOONC_00614 [Cooperia oncophora]
MKLYSIPTPNLDVVIEHTNFYNESRLKNLSEVDTLFYKVNWTQYFLLMAPPEIHDYILQDPLVAVPSTEYLERLNEVLNGTSPRTLTNYVMLQYILSWAPLLGQKYTDLVQWFASSISTTPPRNRSEVCFSETNKHYTLALLAMYARSRSTKVLRPLMEEMLVGIIKGLKDEIEQSKWMSEEFKQVKF